MISKSLRLSWKNCLSFIYIQLQHTVIILYVCDYDKINWFDNLKKYVIILKF